MMCIPFSRPWHGRFAGRQALAGLLAAALHGPAIAQFTLPSSPPSGSPVTASGGFCSPPALGAPCATGGLATLGNAEPSPGFSLGNPIHLANGNKYQLDIDLPPNRSAPGLELVRHYNGLSSQAGALGRNWSLSYDTVLQRRSTGWRLRQADGSFKDITAPLPTPEGFRWGLPNGQQLDFDAQGRLTGIQAGREALLRIERHAGPHALAGLIKRVESASGHGLEFHYQTLHGQAVLQAVDTPLGRFHYQYGQPAPDSGHAAPRLEAVARPDGLQRLYHYEVRHQAGNPYTLTGISLQSQGAAPQRLITWEYDAHGRVISLRQHGRTLPALHVDYLRSARGTRSGITRIRSVNGAQHTIEFRRAGGGYRVLNRGAANPELTDAPVTYDSAWRLSGLDGLHLQRAPGGEPVRVIPQAPGWPGLLFELQRHPAQYHWRSHATGQTTLRADASGRPARLHYANGDSLELRRDAQGRPVSLHYAAARTARQYITRLQWRGRQLQRIEHPFEIETRQYDAYGRITQRRIQRPAIFGAPAASFQEAFDYDEHGRLLRHALPEGGALHYRWRPPGTVPNTLETLHWEDVQGRIQPVVASTRNQPGYHYGNGLELLTLARSSPHADTLVLSNGENALWVQERHYDAQGRVQHDRHEFPAAEHYDHSTYLHDTQSRLQAARHQRPGSADRWWYAWQADGTLAALKHNSTTARSAHPREASGLPLAAAGRALEYGPSRRLETIATESTGATIARYRHNAFGHRIVKQPADGRVTHFLYAHDRLVAEAVSERGDASLTINRRYLYAGLTPVGMIAYPPDGPPRLYAVHADLSGAPRMLTDASQRLRWLASYSPTGQAEHVAGDLPFPLRLPGQYADEETDWHDNLLRTYAADSGHYLEPDPLGPLPGSDAYGYARQQPWRYADPHGLILFAFDGTRYSADSMSNAWILAQAYRDGPAHYHSGPGNSLFLDWDAVVAWRAGRILENQWQALLTSLEQQPAGATVPIDIIGFSRGAALARHFGNRIASHMQDGLFSVDDPLRGRVSACLDLR
ncbi:MAG: RHS repeat protein, partial [Alcaligenaceae bacterium]|nr:RHS repeat protein [Alcaligenaceae bacterium]